jgi:hypothetical protein
VVLLINDNTYALMIALSYICRSCPKEMFEPYVGFKVAIRRNKVQVQDEPTRRDHILEAFQSYGVHEYVKMQQ